MKTFLKKLWKVLITPIPDEEEKEYTGRYYRRNEQKDNSSWCPFCGYSGSVDELRCHLLNDHRV